MGSKVLNSSLLYPPSPLLVFQIQIEGLSARFLSARRLPYMEDAHREGDGRAGNPNNRRPRVEAVPSQHHRHPCGGRRLCTQVRRQWCLHGGGCDGISMAITVTWAHERSLGVLPSHGVRVTIWHCQTKNLCSITEASSRRFCPNCRLIKHFLDGGGKTKEPDGLFLPQVPFGRCAFPMWSVAQPQGAHWQPCSSWWGGDGACCCSLT